ncbi:enoyl-CoA hydratase/isomerase family protein [Spirillospora sp. NPDC046719]
MTPSGPITLERTTPEIATITYSNPPANLVDPPTVTALHAAVTELETDPDVKVAILASSEPGFFVNHFNLGIAEDFPVLPADPITPMWTDLVLRLAKAPFISIAAIRGRTRGGGNELALACDLRYASREHALFGQPEVGAGIVPGGGGTERLPRLIGRDRALEAVLTSYDYDADTAERYGWVTRTMPDADLDAFVDRIAARLASFDRRALSTAKTQINRASLPPDSDIRAAYGEYWTALTWPDYLSRKPVLARAAAEVGIAGIERQLDATNRQP